MTSSNMAILALIISFGAFLISYLNYKRGQRIENENHLFKMKLEIYSKLLGDLDRLTWYLYESITKVNNPKIHNLSPEDINDLADRIDEKIYELGYKATEFSLYFSEKTYDKFEEILDLLFEVDPNITLENFKPYFNKLNTKASDLELIIRDELQLETLNASLFNRIKESKFNFYQKTSSKKGQY